MFQGIEKLCVFFCHSVPHFFFFLFPALNMEWNVGCLFLCFAISLHFCYRSRWFYFIFLFFHLFFFLHAFSFSWWLSHTSSNTLLPAVRCIFCCIFFFIFAMLFTFLILFVIPFAMYYSVHIRHSVSTIVVTIHRVTSAYLKNSCVSVSSTSSIVTHTHTTNTITGQWKNICKTY